MGRILAKEDGLEYEMRRALTVHLDPGGKDPLSDEEVWLMSLPKGLDEEA